MREPAARHGRLLVCQAPLSPVGNPTRTLILRRLHPWVAPSTPSGDGTANPSGRCSPAKKAFAATRPLLSRRTSGSDWRTLAPSILASHEGREGVGRLLEAGNWVRGRGLTPDRCLFAPGSWTCPSRSADSQPSHLYCGGTGKRCERKPLLMEACFQCRDTRLARPLGIWLTRPSARTDRSSLSAPSRFGSGVPSFS
jgi:hypothetical protein